eukprot:5560782-Prymnesium_polylepis.1
MSAVLQDFDPHGSMEETQLAVLDFTEAALRRFPRSEEVRPPAAIRDAESSPRARLGESPSCALPIGGPNAPPLASALLPGAGYPGCDVVALGVLCWTTDSRRNPACAPLARARCAQAARRGARGGGRGGGDQPAEPRRQATGRVAAPRRRRRTRATSSHPWAAWRGAQGGSRRPR